MRKFVIENSENKFYADGHWVQRQLATEYSFNDIPAAIVGTDGETWEQECFDYRSDDPDIRYYPEGAPDGADSSAVIRATE